MLGELQNLRNEHSTCLYTVSSSKAQIETMHKEMNEQILRFSEDRRGLDALNKELERRAITSEAALKRARLNYSIAVNQLQKDLELLSFQVLSMFETNDNLVRQAFAEASQPCFEGYPEMVQNRNLNSETSDAVKLLHCQNQNAAVKKQLLGGDMLLEDLKRSLHLQEELYQKVEEELCEMFLMNVHLDVFSKTLQETLLEASADDRLMKDKLDELTQQLELSTKSKESLMCRLQAAMDDVHTLNEYKASCVSKCNDMALQNQILEANLKSIASENYLLAQKIAEWEELMMECRSYESKYEVCAKEKTELANLLQQESLENGSLQDEISSLQEELKAAKTECDELASVKDNLQKILNFLQDKLGSLLAAYNKHFNGLSLCSKPLLQDLEFKDIMGVVSQLEDFQHNACGKICQLMEEKKDLEDERDIARVSLSTAKSEILVMKEKFEHDVQDMVNTVEVSGALVQKLQFDLEALANRIKVSSEADEKYAQQNKELFSDLARLEVELQQLTSKNRDLDQEILVLGTVTEELGKSKLTMSEFTQKNQILLMSLQEKTDESVKLALELNSLKESLRCLHDELRVERGLRDKLECTIMELTSQLNEKNDQLLHVDLQKAELVRFKQQVSDLELEKSRLGHLLLHCEESLEKVHEDSTLITGLEAQLSEVHEFLVAADVKLIFTRAQYQGQIEEIVQQLQFSDRHLGEVHKKHLDLEATLNHCLAREVHYREENARLMETLESLGSELEASVAQNNILLDSNSVLRTELEEYKNRAAIVEDSYLKDKNQYEVQIEELVKHLQFSDRHLGEVHKKHLDVETTLNECLAREAHYMEENAKLMTTLESLRSELEASVAQNNVLLESNSVITTEIEEYKNRAAIVEGSYEKNKNQHVLEVQQLKHMLATSQGEIENLTVSNEELGIKVVVLKAKLDELRAQITSLEGYNDELMMLQNQCNELTRRLSEQILKTEEFKNLSIHFKELKDRADAECLQAREKRESEGPSVAMQDSLRIAFIKEQYETKLQELRHQLSISKKHGEEMLWKLQDAIDEVENRKKSEASHLKKNEELSLKILELEAELHAALYDKREKVKAYDRIQAELECSLISLECCKEEKQKLEASLQECNDEKARIALELALMKEWLQNSTSTLNIEKEGLSGPHELGSMSGEPVRGKAKEEYPVAGTPSGGRITMDIIGNVKDLDQNSLMNCEVEDACSIPIDEGKHSSALMNVKSEQDVLVTRGVHGIPGHAIVDPENLLQGDKKHLALINDHFKTQSLKSSMDHLHNELERMKNENSFFPQDDHFDPNLWGLQRELMQLHKANEELGSIFPLFNEFSGSGNALERVLALEIELAEALQAKKKSSIHFQSSFLKQHSDEEAVFKSFRDINELIKDMLEVKGRYAAVETELKEMHDRYSQLSLQFAEVEGERQKLMMTLKNVRASKRLLSLNRSSSATLGEKSS
ncbi:hypothetical protein L1049_026904 [Liquidambar formosana]|uniref:Uncharacterized protein n=1 Tax=Liquidambar formosana TaxID=63359 RepID=A0AAP0NH88_LIQFO